MLTTPAGVSAEWYNPLSWFSKKPAAVQTTKPVVQSAQPTAGTPSPSAHKPAATHRDPCAGKPAPCTYQTLKIDSPKPALGKTYVVKHAGDGSTLESIALDLTYTPVKNDRIPFADRFAHTPLLHQYAAALCPGEYLDIETPVGSGIETTMPTNRNSAEEQAIGRDLRIAYDEVRPQKDGLAQIIYDVMQRDGSGKACSSYKVGITAFAKDWCDETAPATEVPTAARQPSVRTPSLAERPSETESRLRPHKAGEHRSYSEITVLAGGGTDQFTGTRTVETKQGLREEAIDPVQYDLNNFKMQYQFFGPRVGFRMNYAGTAGDDAGSPAGPYGMFCSQRINAQAFGIGFDGYALRLGKAGIGGGASFEQKNVKTWTMYEGENSKQSNQTYGGRVFLGVGDFSGSHVIAGVEASAQPINEKYAAETNVYTARSSTETMVSPFLKTRLLFGSNDQGAFDGEFRFSPNVRTLYTSDGQELTRDSKFWNGTIGAGWNFSPHFGIYGQAKFAHNEETFTRPDKTDPKKVFTDRYKHDGQTYSIGLRLTW